MKKLLFATSLLWAIPAFGQSPQYGPSSTASSSTVNVNSQTANYSLHSSDLNNALALGGTGATFTIPSAILTPKASFSFVVTASSAWTLTNSSGLTIVGLNNATSLIPGQGGQFVVSNDGTTLYFYPGLQPATAGFLGGVKIGSGVTVAADGTISVSGGGGITCPTGFTNVAASCAWTQTASNSGNLAWTGLTLSEYTLRCRNLIGASGSPVFVVQVGEGGTPTYQTGANYSNAQQVVFNGGGSGSTSTSNKGLAPNGAPTSGTLGAGLTVNLHGLASSGVTKNSDATAWSFVSGQIAWIGLTSTFDLDTNVITALRVIDTQTSPGNITSGVCTLYAVAP